mgnify:CR=1 FL=1
MSGIVILPMKTLWTHVGLALAMASCTAPSQHLLEPDTVRRISIEYLHANTESLLGMVVEIRGYVRAGYDGGGFSCDMGKSKNSWKDRELVFLNSPICVTSNPQDYKEGMATVRGVVFSRHPDSFIIFNRVYSRELKDVSIEWDK